MSLARLAALYGVEISYEPAPGRIVRVPEDTVVAVLASMGVDAATPQAVEAALERHERRQRERLLPATLVLGGGRPQAKELPGLPEGTRLRLRTEGGGITDWDPAAADELPYGCHTLTAETLDGRAARATVIVAPERMPVPRGRGYGLLVQLYALLSSRSWGMGDLGDLAELAAWAGRTHGCDFVQLNPLHAAVPGAPTDPSPYRPSSRRFPDPVYLRVEDIPEYRYLEPGDRERATGLLARAAALREAVTAEGGLIDRDAVWLLKRQALELIRTVPLTPGRRAAYHDFLAEQGQGLDDHATWNALAEIHGPDWRAWPEGLRHPHGAATGRARGEHLDLVDFHSWLAWLTDSQLGRAQRIARDAGMGIGIVHDLAVGVHPSGSDAWAQQSALAAGMSVGAPPDAFNSRGQDWGLPPWRPDALAAGGYGPYRQVLRGLVRHAGALRIDHVMGLFRLWWIPEGRDPAEGTYVRYDPQAMLGVLALEAHRAGTPVIGEDLGTVEAEVRDALAERGALGTSVLWFERDYPKTAPAEGPAEDSAEAPADPASAPPLPLPPERWREHCLATATTHDLPSTAARLTGDHVALRARLGLLEEGADEARHAEALEVGEWLALLTHLGLLHDEEHDEEAVVRAVYGFLTRTPARMVGVWLPDAVGDRRPANLPGTTDAYPNWRLPVAGPGGDPVTLEQIAQSPRAHALLASVRRGLAGG